MSPRVSIILPNLNCVEYLEERLRSIVAQTMEDWELIIVDSFSEDGSWEVLSEFANSEPRASAFQAPRGLYQSWNAALARARGEYVYIATSDDSMSSDALLKMSRMLDENPLCGICDTPISFVDENDIEISFDISKFPIREFIAELSEGAHIRKYPFDALCYTTGSTVYTSMTQILFRKALLDRIGPFKTSWGPVGDYEWGFRASLCTDTAYLPEKLATWRRHGGQITGKAIRFQHLDKYQMASEALEFAKQIESGCKLLKDRKELLGFLEARSYRDLIRKGGIYERARHAFGLTTKNPAQWVHIAFSKIVPTSPRRQVFNQLQFLSERYQMRSLIEDARIT